MNNPDKLIEDQKADVQKAINRLASVKKLVGYLILFVSFLVIVWAINGVPSNFSTDKLLSLVTIFIITGVTLVLLSFLLKKLDLSQKIRNFVLAIVSSSLIEVLIYI